MASVAPIVRSLSLCSVGLFLRQPSIGGTEIPAVVNVSCASEVGLIPLHAPWRSRIDPGVSALFLAR
jgi:hypothetical protein